MAVMRNLLVEKSKRKTNLVLVSTLIIAIMLAQLGTAKDIPYLSYFAILIATVGVIFSPNEEAIYALFFVLTNNRVLSTGGVSLATLITIIYFIRAYIFRRGTLSSGFMILFVIFLGYSAQYLLFSITHFLQTIKLIVLLIFCVDSFSNRKEGGREHYKKILNYAVTGLIVSVIVAAFFNPSILKEDRFAVSSDSGENALGIIAGILFSHCLIVYFKNWSLDRKRLTIGLLLLIAVGVLTGSKTFLILCGIAVVWVVLPIIVSGNLYKKVLLVSLIVIVTIIGIVILMNQESIFLARFTYLIKRVISPKGGDISTGRFQIWEEYITYLRENLIVLLFGLGSYINAGFHEMAHNMILEQIISYGIVGNTIIIMLYSKSVNIINKSFEANNRSARVSLYNSLPLVLVFAAGMFSHAFVSLTNTILFFLGMLLLQADGTIGGSQNASIMDHSDGNSFS